MQKKPFVALAGNIGSGKSTVAERISKHFGYKLFPEPVLTNRFLPQYYADMPRWSFTLQLEFLIKRIAHHEEIDASHEACIQDRTLLEDPEVFANYLHRLGHLQDHERALYLDYFKRLSRNVRQPDKVIYLSCNDVNVLLARIAKRGRKEEKNIPYEFLQGLNQCYEYFPYILKQTHAIDVLTFDVTNFNIHDPVEEKAFLALVENFLTTSYLHQSMNLRA